MISARPLLSLLLANLASANKALDLLDAEPVNPSSIYQPIAVVDPLAQPANGEKLKPKVNPAPPERWRKELPPILKRELPLNPYVKEVALRGNFEYQFQSGDSGLRRSHLGLALRAFYNLEIEVDGAFDSSGDYLGFETLQARYSVDDDLSLSAGKFRPSFSHEYSTDPSLRWFPELSPLVSQIAPASSLGVMVEGRSWKLGYFSGEADRNVPGLSGHGFLLAGVKRRGWHLDYLHNFDGKRSRAVPLGYRHLVSTGVNVSEGAYDFSSEFFLAKGNEATAWGVTLRAAHWLAQDAVRLVGRYHYAASSEAGGILSGWGVARPISDVVQPFQYDSAAQADSLHSFYLGLNIHFYEDNLLLGTGLEYRTLTGVATGGDTDEWNWSANARLAF